MPVPPLPRVSLRRIAAAVTVLFVLLLGGAALATPSGAGPIAAEAAQTQPGQPTPSTTPATTPLTTPRIVPQPNSGRAPRDSGERGGFQQNLVFAMICFGLVVIGLLIWRDSRRKLAARAAAHSGRTPPPVSAQR